MIDANRLCARIDRGAGSDAPTRSAEGSRLRSHFLGQGIWSQGEPHWLGRSVVARSRGGRAGRMEARSPWQDDEGAGRSCGRAGRSRHRPSIHHRWHRHGRDGGEARLSHHGCDGRDGTRPALLQRLAAVRGRLSLCADQAAAAKWWLSMPMASVSAEGPMPKALSTRRSEEHTSELQSLMRISYAVFCLKKKTNKHKHNRNTTYLQPSNND